MPTQTDKITDLVIAGAGPVGISTALACADRGFSVALITHGDFTVAASTRARALALSPGTQSWLAQIGVWPTLNNHACPYETMQVWDEQQSVDEGIIFDAAEMNLPNLGSIVSYADLQTALLARLKSSQMQTMTATVIHDVQRRPECVELTLESDDKKTTLSTKLLVIAEGANSPLRKRVGFVVDRQNYGQTAITSTVTTAWSHKHIARQRFLADGPLALLPLKDGRCGLVWTTLPEHAEHLAALTDEAFASVVGEVTDHVLGDISAVADRATFSLQKMTARRYVQPRIALIGDAAHVVHPMAGLGMNLGMADGSHLVDTISAGHGADIGELSVLRIYERQARQRNQKIAAGIDCIGELFAWQLMPLVTLRQFGSALINRLPVVKRYLARQATMSSTI